MTPMQRTDAPVEAGPDERGFRISPVTALVAVAVTGVAVVIAALHRASVSEGARQLLAADAEWLTLAGALACLVWVSGTVMQLGVLADRPPLLQLFAVQVAGSFANHVLPAGSGGIAVNVRFLRRLGMTREAALASQALNASAGAVMHLALLVAALVFAPSALRHLATARLDAASDGLGRMLLIGGVLAAAVAAAVVLARRSLPGVRARVAAEYRRLAAVARDPRRAAHLWAGAMAVPVVHSVVLFAVLHATGSPLPLGVVLLVYLGSSTVSALIPSPGGIGSLDVALAAGLAAAGLPVASAVGGLVAYRFLTVWMPLVPGACTLGVLAKRRII
jgi:uncharacterized membrane protein YbhN (UPF0104 family)